MKLEMLCFSLARILYCFYLYLLEYYVFFFLKFCFFFFFFFFLFVGVLCFSLDKLVFSLLCYCAFPALCYSLDKWVLLMVLNSLCMIIFCAVLVMVIVLVS